MCAGGYRERVDERCQYTLISDRVQVGEVNAAQYAVLASLGT